jgi:mRNA-degrading endonuclease RelE of RelBE toxin-antitoxin system
MRIAIAELPEFRRRIAALLSPDERDALIDYLAEHPRAGVLLQDTGGIRKLRWACGARGKRGGIRVIYYVHDERMPLYLLTVFAKNEQSTLRAADRLQLARLVAILKKSAEH